MTSKAGSHNSVEYLWKLLKTCISGNRSSGIRIKQGPDVFSLNEFEQKEFCFHTKNAPKLHKEA